MVAHDAGSSTLLLFRERTSEPLMTCTILLRDPGLIVTYQSDSIDISSKGLSTDRQWALVTETLPPTEQS